MTGRFLLKLAIWSFALAACSAPPNPSAGVTSPRTSSPDSSSTSTNHLPGSSIAVANAISAVDAYTRDLVDGRYRAAFSMLAATSQQEWRSESAFAVERSAFFKSVGDRYTVRIPTPDEHGSVIDWLPSTDRAAIDVTQAALVEVDYPALAGNNAGFNLYIVVLGGPAPLLYDVR